MTERMRGSNMANLPLVVPSGEAGRSEVRRPGPAAARS
ncbi:hypothetical protein CU044_5520 [Streptomyces sp. L-9-10]|nr:hypothetical protein CU044_5520 [Streptomyces sp. L-9-10]